MTRRRTVLLSLSLASLIAALPSAAPPGPARRVVSLVPAATEILFAIGAGEAVVGVSSFDRHPPEVATKARVGALVDPDVERIFGLKPDLVVIYASQDELAAQLSRAGIRAHVYRHGGLAQITAAMRELGTATGHEPGAERAASAFEAAIAHVRAAVANRERPRTLLVFGREPMTLRNVYASGGVGFLHEALVAAGGRNVFEDVARESVQASTELILARAPEVVLEIRAVGLLDSTSRAREEDVWRRLSSLPAVKNGRVHVLDGSALVVPGQRLAAGIELLATTLHPGVL